MNWKCIFGFHQYSKWKVTDHGKITRLDDLLEQPITEGIILAQERECLCCGKCQLRLAKATI